MLSYRNLIVAVLVMTAALTQQPNWSCIRTVRTARAQEPKVTLVTSSLNIDQILEILAKKTGSPNGLEALPCSDALSANPKINISVREGTPRDVLDAVVNSDPRYRWENVGGVVNVVPKEPCNSILDVVVSNFQVQGSDVQQIGDALIMSGEVNRELTRVGIQHLDIRQTTGPTGSHPFSLSFSEVSVKDILNEILRRGIASHWVLERFGDHNQYIQILLVPNVMER